MLVRWTAAVALVLLGVSTAQAQTSGPTFPALSGRVVDIANLLSAGTEAELTDKLAALEASTGRQLVIATTPSLNGYEIEEYGYRLGRAWAIGQAARDDGAILLVAPNERRVRVEVGYGLEGALTDALSSRIIRESVLPRFRANDYSGGIVAGTDALIEQLALPAEEAQARILAAEGQIAPATSDAGGLPGWALLLIVLVVLVIVLRGGARGRRQRRGGLGIPPVVVWGGSSGWGGGGGFGGSGAFRGGGGSFGGGGASGSW